MNITKCTILCKIVNEEESSLYLQLNDSFIVVFKWDIIFQGFNHYTTMFTSLCLRVTF